MADSQSDFVWYELATDDVASVKTFYADVMGWHYHDMHMPDMTYTLLHAEAPDVSGARGMGGMMPIPPAAAAAGMKPHWVGYLHADDVDRSAARVEQLGGGVHRGPMDIPTVGRFAVVSDPQGAHFYLFKPTPPEGAAPSTGKPRQPTPGQVVWHELSCSDWPRAFAFYHAMFGWHEASTIDMGGMGKYRTFSIGGTAAGGMMNGCPATSHGFWLYYFGVDDIEAAAARITRSGGTVMMAPRAVPGGGWIVQATDPRGAWFALSGPKK